MDYKFPSAARGSRAATPLGWAPALRPPRKAALAARGGEVAERGQEVGAARPGARGAGSAGEGTAHLSTCPTPRGHLAYPSLAILICAMGIATPVAWGEGTFMEKKGRSGWKEPGAWMAGDSKKSPDNKGRDWGRSLVGGAWRGGVSR